MMKKIKLLLVFLIITAFSYAQNTLKGIVSNSKGEPLAGVNIVGRGFEGIVTNVNGEFSFIVPQGVNTLVVSYLGYYPKEISIDSQTLINVTLSEVEEELVIVGYGTQKKAKTTIALSSINSKQLTDMPITNFVQVLQGRIAGVDVTQSGSKPGGIPTIRIRGRRSFSGSNGPMYVVDGMPIIGGYEDFNVNDIESVEVLKDAAATAIYGVGGANGVLLITTKRGQLGGNNKTTISYDNYYGPSEVYQLPTLFSGTEFAEYARESRRGATSGFLYKDAAGNPVPTGIKNDFADSNIETFDANVLKGIETGRNTQYQELMLRRGNIQNHTLGMQGNYQKTAFYVSGSYFKDNGISVGLDYTRMSFHSRLDIKLNKLLKFGLSTYGTYGINNGENLNPYALALQQNPLGSPYLADGVTLNFKPTNDGLLTNPLFEIQKGAQIDERKTYRIFNSLYAELQILDGLTYRVNFGPDYSIDKTKRFIGSMTNAKRGFSNEAGLGNFDSFNWTLENMLNYTKTFGKHHLDLTALFSIQKYLFESNTRTVIDLPNEIDVFNNFAVGKTTSLSTNAIGWKTYSYMSRLNYDYDNKYLFTATLRRAGKIFHDDLNYGNLPAIALGWNITNEAFIKGKIRWLDALKLRVSWGTVGNNTNIIFGITPGALGNQNIISELSTTKNVGLDFSILRGRVMGSFELYRVGTKNALLNTQIPTSTGFKTVTVNAGETQNQGIEATLTTINVNKGGFKWISDFIFTKNKEQILSLYNSQTDDVSNRLFIGKPLTAFYDYTKQGIWQLGEEDKAKSFGSRVGQIKVTDKNNDGKITAEDRSYIGTEVPDWTGSITNRFSFKGFDLSIMVFARIGQTIRSGFHANNNQLAGRFQQIKVDYWTPKNSTNAYPQPNRDQEFPLFNTTLLYFDGSFVKIRNINLGYTFPNTLTQKLRMESLRFFTSIQQPKIWSSYINQHNGVDPEIEEGTSTGGNITPSTHVITMGLNVKF
jgi:TonB-linked SusC/RagA family outer membrane protein